MPVADGLAGTEPERAALSALREASGEIDGVMERHCVRAYRIAVKLADGAPIDNEALVVAAFLHDAGLYMPVSGDGPYVSEGRALADKVLAPFDWPEERLRLTGDAIERHHHLRSQASRGAEVELLRKADQIEVAGGAITLGLSRAWLKELFAEVPRTGFYAGLMPLIARELRSRPLSFARIVVAGS